MSDYRIGSIVKGLGLSILLVTINPLLGFWSQSVNDALCKVQQKSLRHILDPKITKEECLKIIVPFRDTLSFCRSQSIQYFTDLLACALSEDLQENAMPTSESPLVQKILSVYPNFFSYITDTYLLNGGTFTGHELRFLPVFMNAAANNPTSNASLKFSTLFLFDGTESLTFCYHQYFEFFSQKTVELLKKPLLIPWALKAEKTAPEIAQEIRKNAQITKEDLDNFKPNILEEQPLEKNEREVAKFLSQNTFTFIAESKTGPSAIVASDFHPCQMLIFNGPEGKLYCHRQLQDLSPIIRQIKSSFSQGELHLHVYANNNLVHKITDISDMHKLFGDAIALDKSQEIVEAAFKQLKQTLSEEGYSLKMTPHFYDFLLNDVSTKWFSINSQGKVGRFIPSTIPLDKNLLQKTREIYQYHEAPPLKSVLKEWDNVKTPIGFRSAQIGLNKSGTVGAPTAFGIPRFSHIGFRSAGVGTLKNFFISNDKPILG